MLLIKKILNEFRKKETRSKREKRYNDFYVFENLEPTVDVLKKIEKRENHKDLQTKLIEAKEIKLETKRLAKLKGLSMNEVVEPKPIIDKIDKNKKIKKNKKSNLFEKVEELEQKELKQKELKQKELEQKELEQKELEQKELRNKKFKQKEWEKLQQKRLERAHLDELKKNK